MVYYNQKIEELMKLVLQIATKYRHNVQIPETLYNYEHP
jgi:arabinogalactan endo-1,4-beta-galactosidase